MPLRIRSQDTGAIILDISDRITRLIGTIAISGNGSYTFPSSEGTPMFFIRYPSSVDQNNSAASISLGGANNKVLTWTQATAGTQVILGLY